MALQERPIILDETGKEIVDALKGIKARIDAGSVVNVYTTNQDGTKGESVLGWDPQGYVANIPYIPQELTDFPDGALLIKSNGSNLVAQTGSYNDLVSDKPAFNLDKVEDAVTLEGTIDFAELLKNTDLTAVLSGSDVDLSDNDTVKALIGNLAGLELKYDVEVDAAETGLKDRMTAAEEKDILLDSEMAALTSRVEDAEAIVDAYGEIIDNKLGNLNSLPNPEKSLTDNVNELNDKKQDKLSIKSTDSGLIFDGESLAIKTWDTAGAPADALTGLVMDSEHNILTLDIDPESGLLINEDNQLTTDLQDQIDELIMDLYTGDFVVGSAYADSEGNVITSTYATKDELVSTFLSEKAERMLADSELAASIEATDIKFEAITDDLTAKLDSECAARELADSELAADINLLAEEFKTTLEDLIEDFSSKLVDEMSARMAGDSELADDLSTLEAEFREDLADEIAIRVAGDSELASKHAELRAEMLDAIATKDSELAALSAKFESDLADEIAARKLADSELDDKLSDTKAELIGSLGDHFAALTRDFTDADAELSNKIVALDTKLDSEIAARESVVEAADAFKSDMLASLATIDSEISTLHSDIDAVSAELDTKQDKLTFDSSLIKSITNELKVNWDEAPTLNSDDGTITILVSNSQDLPILGGSGSVVKGKREYYLSVNKAAVTKDVMAKCEDLDSRLTDLSSRLDDLSDMIASIIEMIDVLHPTSSEASEGKF